MLVTQRQRQLDSIRSGFYTIDWNGALGSLNALDLCSLVRGSTVLDAESILANIDFRNGDWTESKTLKYLDRFLHELEMSSHGGLRLFLQFVTGRPTLPLGGLQKKISLVRVPGSDRLPEAHTCFDTLDLPEYENYHILRSKFLTAMMNDDGRFDLF